MTDPEHSETSPESWRTSRGQVSKPGETGRDVLLLLATPSFLGSPQNAGPCHQIRRNADTHIANSNGSGVC